MTSATGRKKGLTFIEILIVIIIIGILAGASLPLLKRSFDSLQFNNFSRELQSFMKYMAERSIVEGRVIYLHVDKEAKEYWAQIDGEAGRLKSFSIPNDINVEGLQDALAFYPDGSIDKVSFKLEAASGAVVSLTTKGVFSGVKAEE